MPHLPSVYLRRPRGTMEPTASPKMGHETTRGTVSRTPAFSTTPTYPVFSNAATNKPVIFSKLILRPDSCLNCLHPAPRDKDKDSGFPKIPSPGNHSRSPALSVIFIFSLHSVHCLLCFRLFLHIFVCTRLFTVLGLSSLCHVIRSSDRNGVK